MLRCDLTGAKCFVMLTSLSFIFPANNPLIYYLVDICQVVNLEAILGNRLVNSMYSISFCL